MYRIKRSVKINGRVRTVHCMVIPEQRRVIARLYGCELDAIESFVNDSGFAPLNIERWLMAPSYEASAVCHPEDEFDPEIGADVAVKKLGENYQRAHENKLDGMCDWIEDHLTDVRFKVKNRK